MSEESPIPDDVDRDSIVLPEGYDLDDIVEWDSEVEAWLAGSYPKAFNPQNGRMYELQDPGHTDHNHLHVIGGLRVNCAYADCDGFTTVTVEGTVDATCEECGERSMGREQFSSANQQARERHSNISSRTKNLRDDLAQEMKRLTDAGVSSQPAMDYLMCSIGEIPYQEWAEARGVKPESVKRNMQRVAQTIGGTVTYKTRS